MNPISHQETVRLVDCGVSGVKEAHVLSFDSSGLEWDRYQRMESAAACVRALNLSAGTVVLDVGGFDGSIAVLLPNLRVWVVDPATTGWDGTSLPFADKLFEVVVSVDAIEHVEPPRRELSVREMVRVCRRKLFVNYPAEETMAAQSLVLQLTGHRFIAEHVKYGLLHRDALVALIRSIGGPSVKVLVRRHTSLSVWVAWFVLFQLRREEGLAVSAFLKEKTGNVPESGPLLYDLLECHLDESDDAEGARDPAALT